MLDNSKIVNSYSDTTGSMRFLYETCIGRFLLKLLVNPWVSRLVAGYMNSPLSRPRIKRFIKNNNIRMEDYACPDKGDADCFGFKNFNEFFTRRLADGARTFSSSVLDAAMGAATDAATDAVSTLVSPADSRLSVFKINNDSVFKIKNTLYDIKSLLQNEELASHYVGGTAMIFRLTVSDYHRYGFPCAGTMTHPAITIPGRLHTVNPISNSHFKTYIENAREYTVLNTDAFGHIVQMEVGALLVGKIVNLVKKDSETLPANATQNAGYLASKHLLPKRFVPGEEKGYFEFGGSTIILLFEKDCVDIPEELFKISSEMKEYLVKYGEPLAAL